MANCTDNPLASGCISTYSQFCSDLTNITGARCREFCAANPAACDPAMATYCARNPADPYCACINSKAADPAIGVNPVCVDAACAKDGYLTASMRATPCPSIINCTVQASLQNSGMSLSSSIPIQQNCGAASNTTSSTSAPAPTQIGQNAPISAPITGASSSWTMMFVLILAVLLILGGAIAVEIDSAGSAPKVSA